MSAYQSQQSVNINHAINTIEYFCELVAQFAEERNHPQASQISKTYLNFILNNKDSIVQIWQKELSYYIVAYDIHPENNILDEFKNFFFIGTAIATELQNQGHKDLTTFQLLAIQKLFDFRLFKVNSLRPDLTIRLVKAIDNASITTDFGRFGWYITYKCLFNAAKDVQNKAP